MTCPFCGKGHPVMAFRNLRKTEPDGSIRKPKFKCSHCGARYIPATKKRKAIWGTRPQKAK
jgi:transcriptional regulator NrdR family protein